MLVDEATHSDLKTIMQENSKVIAEKYPANTFQHLFWQQQAEASSTKDARQMRWHPLMIKWCLYLRHLSSGAYETLRTSGCIALPSQRTLRDYTHYVRAVPGFSEEVDTQLIDAARVETCEEFQKYVVVVADEMHLKEDLVYDKNSGELIGFVNLGETNNHLLQLERRLESNESDCEVLANLVVVLMVGGLFTRLQFPYAQFPCSTLTGDLLFDPFWEAVSRLERCGMKVLALTCDGASVNRRLFNLHELGQPGVYKVINPYTSENRFIFFFCDPPYLMKTVRNGWQNRKRHLWCCGKEIKWEHLVELYEQDRGTIREAPGLSLVPKLKFEHLNLTFFSKMRVDLAAQVLSESVATTMKMMGGDRVKETVRFIEMFDKFFDCLNVNNFTTSHHKRKVFKLPYKSASDFRLKWLKETFLGYLSEWEKSVEERPDFTKKAKKAMMLSPETRLGLKITVNSFVELVEFIFTIPGVKVFLSERLCQDPLEKYFGCQRQRGRVNENPNAAQFLKNTQALRVVNTFCAGSVRGNCRQAVDFEAENQPLPKRRCATEQ